MGDEVPISLFVVGEGDGAPAFPSNHNEPVLLPHTNDSLQEVRLTGGTYFKQAPSSCLLACTQNRGCVALCKVLCAVQVLPLLFEDPFLRAKYPEDVIPHHRL
eukprot:11237950-Prorocentrum_lima.AAC.1